MNIKRDNKTGGRIGTKKKEKRNEKKKKEKSKKKGKEKKKKKKKAQKKKLQEVKRLLILLVFLSSLYNFSTFSMKRGSENTDSVSAPRHSRTKRALTRM
jgi:hypothetical protein